MSDTNIQQLRNLVGQYTNTDPEKLAGMSESELKQLAATQANTKIQEILQKMVLSSQLMNSIGQSGGNSAGTSDAPTLSAPDPKALETLKNLSGDALMSMLSNDERQTAVKTGLSTLKANAEKRKQEQDKILKNLQEQVKKLEEQEKLSPFQKIFSWVSAIVSTIVGIASTVAGALTANPLLIAGGIMLTISGVDSIVQQATGKGMFQHALEAAGVDKETAMWVGMGISLALSIAGSVCTGVGASRALNAVDIADKAKTVANTVKTVSLVAGSTSQIVSGSLGIASSQIEKSLVNLNADKKLVDAILAKLQSLDQMETEYIQGMLERATDTVNKVKDCISGMNKTLASVTTGGGQMA
ncbi:MAG: type III secretion system translocon subunit SctE [Succinivibrio sp.]|nr:type III secretion system translocon subunit SctE [Succinivibrio sp.]